MVFVREVKESSHAGLKGPKLAAFADQGTQYNFGICTSTAKIPHSLYENLFKTQMNRMIYLHWKMSMIGMEGKPQNNKGKKWKISFDYLPVPLSKMW